MKLTLESESKDDVLGIQNFISSKGKKYTKSLVFPECWKLSLLSWQLFLVGKNRLDGPFHFMIFVIGIACWLKWHSRFLRKSMSTSCLDCVRTATKLTLKMTNDETPKPHGFHCVHSWIPASAWTAGTFNFPSWKRISILIWKISNIHSVSKLMVCGSKVKT